MKFANHMASRSQGALRQHLHAGGGVYAWMLLHKYLAKIAGKFPAETTKAAKTPLDEEGRT